MSNVFKNQHYMNFGAKNECTAKRNDPLSSYEAADKASHTLNDDLEIVLRKVSEHDGLTAKELGYKAAWAVFHGLPLTYPMLEAIQEKMDLPHKKMSKLVGLGFVRIEERAGGNLCWITDLGRKQLPSNPR